MAGNRIRQLMVAPGIIAGRLFGNDFLAAEAAWVKQYLRTAGVADLCQQEIDADCLRLLNRRQAWQFHLLPLHRAGRNLCLATDAADWLRATKFAVRKFNEPVFVAIVWRRQLREFLMRHYPVPEPMARYADTFSAGSSLLPRYL